MGWAAVMGAVLVACLLGCTGSSFCPDCATASPVTAAGYPSGDQVSVTGQPITPIQPAPSGGMPTDYLIVSGALPPGLSLNPTTGVISGTPTTTGVYTVTVQASNGAGSTDQTLTFTEVSSASLSVSYSTPLSFPAGTAIAEQKPTVLNATPGVTTTFAVTSGTLPPGLALGADGGISGTPTTPEYYAFTITASNGTRSGSCSLDYTVTPAGTLTLNYSTPMTFPAGIAIAGQVPTLQNATPGVTTTFAVTTGTLPKGLSLGANGTISGTPTTAGVYPFTVTASNGTRNASSSVSYTITPAGTLTLSYATPMVFPAGSAITSQAATVQNATPGVTTTFAVTTGALPTGLGLGTDGSISGTPTVAGVYGFIITATNGTRKATSSVSYTITPAGALTLSYTTPLTFPVNAAITSQAATVQNATPGVATTFAVTSASGTFPTGLHLGTDGSITGTPTVEGPYSFTITATNGTRTAPFTLAYTISPAAALTLSYPTPPTFIAGTAIADQAATVQNATPGVTTTFAATGNFPNNLNLGTDGSISGTVGASGVYSFTITATNGTRSAHANLTYTVNPAAAMTLSYTTPLTFPVNAGIASQPATVQNANPDITTTFAVTSGTFPPGLNLGSDGSITGTPTTTGLYGFTVTATNGSLNAQFAVSYTISPAAALTLSYPAPPSTVTVNVTSISLTPTVTNATNGVNTTFALTSAPSTFPPGLTLAASGLISGTPTTVGNYTFTITATNGTRTANAQVTIDVLPAPPTVGAVSPASTSLCPGGSVTLSVSASGTGTLTYQWYRDTTAVGTNSNQYSVTGATTADDGSYSCKVTNAGGTTTSSSPGAVSVDAGPTINSGQPADASITAGTSTTLTVTAGGNGLHYQWWQVGTPDTAVGTDAANFTTPALTTTTAYYVVVTDSCSLSVTSRTATVTVGASMPVITSQPNSLAAGAGSSTGNGASGSSGLTAMADQLGTDLPVAATFSVAASGGGTLAYQWYRIPAGSGATGLLDPVGGDSATLTLASSATQPADDGDQYYAIVSNAYGQAASAAATLAVGNGILLPDSGQPRTVLAAAGAQATFAVAPGSADAGALQYQWYGWAPGAAGFAAIPGATAASYAVGPVSTAQSGSLFHCVISSADAGVAPVTSADAALFVDAAGSLGALDAGWQLNGDALQDGAAIQLTGAGANQAGSAFWPQPICTARFSLSFTVALDQPSPVPGDGFALVFADPSRGAAATGLGAAGSGLGARGIPGTLLAFDTLWHPAQGTPGGAGYLPADPPVPYLGLGRAEPARWAQPWDCLSYGLPQYPGSSTDVQSASSFASSSHRWTVAMADGNLTVAMDGTPVLSAAVSLPPAALVGFTAGTGDHWEHVVVSDLNATISEP
jgi:hypothetical protein